MAFDVVRTSKEEKEKKKTHGHMKKNPEANSIFFSLKAQKNKENINFEEYFVAYLGSLHQKVNGYRI